MLQEQVNYERESEEKSYRTTYSLTARQFSLLARLFDEIPQQ